jgi:hypothetical protein
MTWSKAKTPLQGILQRLAKCHFGS